MSGSDYALDRHRQNEPGELGLPLAPRHRCLIAVDIEGSSARTNVARGHLRRMIYEILEDALQAAGIEGCHRDTFVDRGDGILALIHPVDEVPKTLLLDTVMPRMSMLLARHNTIHPDRAFRMRAAMHAGEVHFDGHGCYGEAVDLTCRLLDSPELKRWMATIGPALALVVSDDIYASVVRHGYEGIDIHDFQPVIEIALGGHTTRGWVSVPEPFMIPSQSIVPVADLASRRRPGRHAR